VKETPRCRTEEKKNARKVDRDGEGDNGDSESRAREKSGGRASHKVVKKGKDRGYDMNAMSNCG